MTALDMPSGAARPSLRAREVESAWLRSTRTHRHPAFWSDVAIRRAAIDLYGVVTLDGAREQLVAAFGEERAPTRSAIGRFWRQLDHFLGRR